MKVYVTKHSEYVIEGSRCIGVRQGALHDPDSSPVPVGARLLMQPALDDPLVFIDKGHRIVTTRVRAILELLA